MDKIDIKKKFLTLFILIFPSIIIAAIPGDSWISICLKALLVFYQFVVIKNFVEEYYG